MKFDKYEQEILDKVKYNRIVSYFWLDEKRARFRAMHKLEKMGVLTFKPIRYPMYKVVLHRQKKAGIK